MDDQMLATRHEPREAEVLDRTPMEAAVSFLGEEITRLELLMREHHERLDPILSPEREGGGDAVDGAVLASSDRVNQLTDLAQRVARANGYLRSLTMRVEA